MTLLDRKSNFNCEIYAWGFKENMHDFSHEILSNLKGQLAKTPQARTMANKGGNL